MQLFLEGKESCQEESCAETALQEAEEVDLRRQVAVSHLFLYYKANKEGSGFTYFVKP